jgi:hypothetical protein
MAEALFEFVENNQFDSGPNLNCFAPYGGTFAPMKTFVQERLTNVVLNTYEYKIYVPPNNQFFNQYPLEYRRSLVMLDGLKLNYLKSNDKIFLATFDNLRSRLFAESLDILDLKLQSEVDTD